MSFKTASAKKMGLKKAKKNKGDNAFLGLQPRWRTWRHYLVVCVFVLCSAALASRVVYLGVTQRDFLQQEGDSRSIHEQRMPGMRGLIYDRNGEPLAVSTPVFAVSINPSKADLDASEVRQLAQIIDLPVDQLSARITEHRNRQFLYLKRHLSWTRSEQLHSLALAHLDLQPEYQRYYPAGETAAHVVGMTDIDDRGLEGIEYAFDQSLRGEAGAKTVLRDLRGNSIGDLEYLKVPQFGEDIFLSLDIRLQYIAYRELKSAVVSHQAKSGSLIMVDAKNGEILALVNQPSYNPNDVSGYRNSMRNRVVTDAYEPGSTIKPFAVLAALETGRYDQETTIDTSPGYFRVGRKLIQDPINRSTLSLSEAIQKSSQVAIAKLALDLEDHAVFDVLARGGIGSYIGTGLPGEVQGFFSDAELQYPVVRATLAYGYGLSVTPLQLASAYVTLANYGEHIPLSIMKGEAKPRGEEAFAAEDARRVIEMMELVTSEGGTASAAAVPGYRVAGKTGTARLVGSNGYDDERHVAWFAGALPVSDPRIVMVVLINEASAGQVGGGALAAPVFARVAERSMHLLGVQPDQPALASNLPQGETVAQGGDR